MASMAQPMPKNSRQKKVAVEACVTHSDAAHRNTTQKLKPVFPLEGKLS